jgi:hypothetical protein
MTMQPNAFILARDIASEFEDILDVVGLASAIDNLNGSLSGSDGVSTRDISLAGNIASLAGLFVSLVAFVVQYRLGNTGSGQTEEAITERLLNKLISETDLPARTRERLINKLIDIEFDLDK